MSVCSRQHLSIGEERQEEMALQTEGGGNDSNLAAAAARIQIDDETDENKDRRDKTDKRDEKEKKMESQESPGDEEEQPDEMREKHKGSTPLTREEDEEGDAEEEDDAGLGARLGGEGVGGGGDPFALLEAAAAGDRVSFLPSTSILFFPLVCRRVLLLFFALLCLDKLLFICCDFFVALFPSAVSIALLFCSIFSFLLRSFFRSVLPPYSPPSSLPNGCSFNHVFFLSSPFLFRSIFGSS